MSKGSSCRVWVNGSPLMRTYVAVKVDDSWQWLGSSGDLCQLPICNLVGCVGYEALKKDA